MVDDSNIPKDRTAENEPIPDNRDCAVNEIPENPLTVPKNPDESVTSNMDLSHSIHHAPGKKKHFKHYVFEFLMLFLAITAGFFVENQREHYMEYKRAKIYAAGLLEDLKIDTAELRECIRDNSRLYSYFDSINSIIKENKTHKLYPGKFYYYSRVASTINFVSWTNSTITQVIYSGNLRYFNNYSLIKNINEYHRAARLIDGGTETDNLLRLKSVELRNKVLHSDHYAKFASIQFDEDPTIYDSLIAASYPLLNYDETLLNEYANSFQSRKPIIKASFESSYRWALRIATALIADLKKEYQLE